MTVPYPNTLSGSSKQVVQQSLYLMISAATMISSLTIAPRTSRIPDTYTHVTTSAHKEAAQTMGNVLSM